MSYFYDILSMIEADKIYIIRLVVAVVLGAFVGFERQSRGRSAGLRTNILVCLGSAAAVVAFDKLFATYNLDSGSIIRMDPSRVAAGVITGVGFLGAGTIIKNTNFVRGLTTAASIWIVSAIGITVGLGEYTIAVFLTVMALTALYILHYIPVKSDSYISLILEWTGDVDLLNEIIDKLEKEKVSIKSQSMKAEPKTKKFVISLGLKLRYKWYDNAVLKDLYKDSRLDKIKWQ